MTKKLFDINPALAGVFGDSLRYVTSIIEETDQTYPIKPELWDNWFTFAYLAFQKFHKKIKSFASIGTGPGADAIGAHCAFPDLERIIITDINHDVVDVARGNVEIKTTGAEVVALCGNLCQPLMDAGLKADLIYGNLPNIPEAGLIIEGYRTASRYDPKKVIDEKKFGLIDTSLHEKTKDFLQESQLAFLIDARESLNEWGSVIIALGGRVPLGLFYEMAQAAGYGHCDELVAGFKRQTEPREILPGFAAAENNGVSFDFYRYRDVKNYLLSLGMKNPFTELGGDVLKKALGEFKLSAREAWNKYQRDNSFEIGHTVHMIEARKPIA